jgi:hypothetical protein
MARVDLPFALELAEGRGIPDGRQPEPPAGTPKRIISASRSPRVPWQVDDARAAIARRVATTDPAAARRVLGLIDESRRPHARRAVCLAMAATDLPAARLLAAEANDPMLEALVPAVAARARETSEPETARALLRESVQGLTRFVVSDRVGQPSTAEALIRLVPLATRVDPDRAPGYLWLTLSLRMPLSATPESMPVIPKPRRAYLDQAELAAWVARFDGALAEVVFAPVADRLAGLVDETWGLGAEGNPIFQAAAAVDVRLARRLLDTLPEDPARPPGPAMMGRITHHTKADARIALARALALPPALRLNEVHTGPNADDLLDALDR